MEDLKEKIEKNAENEKDISPFRTASIMVNRVCNLKCPHCDIPEKYTSRAKMLSGEKWVEVIQTLDREIDLRLVAVSAREPLTPGATRSKTLRIVDAARQSGKISGIVTNGYYLKGALPEIASSGLVMDYMDVSLEGPREVDEKVRGKGHFDRVVATINDERLMKATEKFFISFTLNAWNCGPDTLRSFLRWMLKTFDEPRLAVLALYPNQHVPKELWLTDDQFLRALEILLEVSGKFSDIFIDAFSGSIPGFREIVQKNDLPGKGELLRDDTGMLWGFVGENLYVRYENIRDLARYQVRVTPEGRLIMPRDLEAEDYLRSAKSSVLSADWNNTLNGILDEVNRIEETVDPECLDQRCFPACRGDNSRCAFINGGPK